MTSLDLTPTDLERKMSETIDTLRIEQAAWCEGWRPTPLWVRLLGARRRFYADRKRERTFHLPWGELTLRRTGAALMIAGYETAHLQVTFLLFSLFIRLPFLDRAICGDGNFIEGPRFGFSIHGDTAIHLNWGRRYKIIDWPWSLEQIMRQYLAADGQWVDGWPRGDGPEPYSERHPYHYMLASGEVQHVEATLKRTRSAYGWKWFGSGSISRFLRRIGPKERFEAIDIQFSDEVGERAGSWKGGCVGCSYEMKPGETPRHTLLRMQGERRFS